MAVDIFTSFTRILSGPIAFSAFKLILFLWTTVTALIFSYALAGNYSSLIVKMLGWFFNLSMIVATISFSINLLAKVPNFVGYLHLH